MKEALDKFLESWHNNNDVVGILLTGSHAIEMNHKTSDIDIRIFVTEGFKTTKGLMEIDGFKFSYLVRSHNIIESRFKKEFSMNSRFEATTISMGKIIFEKDGILSELQKLAHHYQGSDFIKRDIDDESLKSNIYLLYNYKNYLDTLEEDSPYFIYTYMSFMKISLNFYSHFLNFEIVSDLKTEKLFTNELFRDKCNWSKFPDEEFAILWQNCISTGKTNKHNITKMFNFLQDKVIKFNIKNHTFSWQE
ncbi:nucleotidyltransferase-like protein [Flavobacterium sp. 9]|uniref:nucleotidyltransferase domain-containing protein n=1 Tax=Flavobacterium sp. 9 TaxID=2035198 RepID=UPI000C191A20|nr:nucleotidyltransferase domain-containing protein [Flavobacterium sp. 9]PIF31803.1 nucleotidyltransferase-like protein [Flavobacterium sp. 9]